MAAAPGQHGLTKITDVYGGPFARLRAFIAGIVLRINAIIDWINTQTPAQASPVGRTVILATHTNGTRTLVTVVSTGTNTQVPNN